MTDRAEIERLLNQTGRTLEGLPKQDEYIDREDYRHRRVDPQEDGDQQGQALEAREGMI